MDEPDVIESQKSDAHEASIARDVRTRFAITGAFLGLAFLIGVFAGNNQDLLQLAGMLHVAWLVCLVWASSSYIQWVHGREYLVQFITGFVCTLVICSASPPLLFLTLPISGLLMLMRRERSGAIDSVLIASILLMLYFQHTQMR